MCLDMTLEALRYLGAGRGAPEELRQSVERAAQELSGQVKSRYVYRIFSLEPEQEGFSLPQAGLLLTGQTARTMLTGCAQAALLCCTLGARFDALLRACQVRDMAQAVILDACGSALVEEGCDAAQEEMVQLLPGKFLTDRFSPGYGDLPLPLQQGLCAALDASRRLGVHVTRQYLLNPGKTVTAVVGISGKPQPARVRGCAFCSMRERCTLYKGGKTCGV